MDSSTEAKQERYERAVENLEREQLFMIWRQREKQILTPELRLRLSLSVHKRI